MVAGQEPEAAVAVGPEQGAAAPHLDRWPRPRAGLERGVEPRHRSQPGLGGRGGAAEQADVAHAERAQDGRQRGEVGGGPGVGAEPPAAELEQAVVAAGVADEVERAHRRRPGVARLARGEAMEGRGEIGGAGDAEAADPAPHEVELLATGGADGVEADRLGVGARARAPGRHGAPHRWCDGGSLGMLSGHSV